MHPHTTHRNLISLHPLIDGKAHFFVKIENGDARLRNVYRVLLVVVHGILRTSVLLRGRLYDAAQRPGALCPVVAERCEMGTFLGAMERLTVPRSRPQPCWRGQPGGLRNMGELFASTFTMRWWTVLRAVRFPIHDGDLGGGYLGHVIGLMHLGLSLEEVGGGDPGSDAERGQLSQTHLFVWERPRSIFAPQSSQISCQRVRGMQRCTAQLHGRIYTSLYSRAIQLICVPGSGNNARIPSRAPLHERRQWCDRRSNNDLMVMSGESSWLTERGWRRQTFILPNDAYWTRTAFMGEDETYEIMNTVVFPKSCVTDTHQNDLELRWSGDQVCPSLLRAVESMSSAFVG